MTVCEQSPQVGGKLGLLKRDGFRFDTGPSLVTLPQVFRELFTDTGAPLESVVDLRPVEPIARYRWADGARLDATADPDAMHERLDGGLSPGSGDDWRAFLGHAAAVWRAVEGPFLRSALRGPADLLRQAVRVRDLVAIAPHRTLRQLGRRHLRDPRLRMVLDRYATYSGSDPRVAPAALAVVPYVEQAFGAWYVRGGLYRLGEAIRDRAVERGAALRTAARVARIELAGGRVAGVRLADGQRLAADVVIANTDAAHLYRDLVAGRAAVRARSALARATPSLSGFVLLLGVRGYTPGLAHHNVLFPADYDAEFDAVFGPRPRPVGDPTLYVSAPDDPAVAPAGCQAWFVLVNAPRQGQRGPVGAPVDWDAGTTAGAYADHLLDLLAARGFDVSGRLRFREVITPADLERRTGAVGGAIYGTSSNGPRAAFLRPANRSPVPGLFLVGGSSHPGGGLPLVTLSARIVAGLVGQA